MDSGTTDGKHRLSSMDSGTTVNEGMRVYGISVVPRSVLMLTCCHPLPAVLDLRVVASYSFSLLWVLGLLTTALRLLGLLEMLFNTFTSFCGLCVLIPKRV